MQSLLKDEAFIRAAPGELQAYLLSDALYWQLSPLPEDRAAGELISLTPGNLLLTFKRLAACRQGGGKASRQFDEPAGQVTRLRSQWRSAWLKKARREFSARLKLWKSFLADSEAEGQLVDYAFQVRWRTILDLLAEDGVIATPQQTVQLELLDEKLRRLTGEGAFTWEAETASAFPPGSFWYLYRVQR